MRFMEVKVEVSEFPSNCGIKLLTDFGFEDGSAFDDGPSCAAVTQWLTEKKAMFRTKAMLILSLNRPQKAKFEKLVIKSGFKPVAEGYNNPHPETQSITLYVCAFDEKQVAIGKKRNGIIKR